EHQRKRLLARLLAQFGEERDVAADEGLQRGADRADHGSRTHRHPAHDAERLHRRVAAQLERRGRHRVFNHGKILGHRLPGMTTRLRIIPGALMFSLFGLAIAAHSPALHTAGARPTIVTLSIVATSDLHGAAFPRNGLGGLPLLAGYVNNLR